MLNEKQIELLSNLTFEKMCLLYKTVDPNLEQDFDEFKSIIIEEILPNADKYENHYIALANAHLILVNRLQSRARNIKIDKLIQKYDTDENDDDFFKNL